MNDLGGAGYQRSPNGFLDNKEGPGAYYLSHAEKQASTLNPGADAISVNRAMCDDCIGAFQAKAKSLGKAFYVSDPDVINIFRPNGRWDAMNYPSWM